MSGASIARRTAALACVGVAMLVLGLLAVFVAPRDEGIKNQGRIVRLLGGARLNQDPNGAQRVCLSDELCLTPGIEQPESGYRLRAAAGASRFTIEAIPLVPGKTGVFSFFRDKDGRLRFEPILGKVATQDSRLWASSVSK